MPDEKRIDLFPDDYRQIGGTKRWEPPIHWGNLGIFIAFWSVITFIIWLRR